MSRALPAKRGLQRPFRQKGGKACHVAFPAKRGKAYSLLPQHGDTGAQGPQGSADLLLPFLQLRSMSSADVLHHTSRVEAGRASVSQRSATPARSVVSPVVAAAAMVCR